MIYPKVGRVAVGAAHPFFAASFAKAVAESSLPSSEFDEGLPPFGDDCLPSARVLVSDMTDLAVRAR